MPLSVGGHRTLPRSVIVVRVAAFGGKSIDRHHRHVAKVLERIVRIIDVSNAARHAGRKVASGFAQDNDHAARHVLATMIADAFDHCDRAGIAHGKALACDALEIGLAGDGPIKHRVADDDVFKRRAGDAFRLANDHAPARKTLADIIVGVAFQVQRDAARQEAAKALSRRSGHRDMDRVFRQACVTMLAGNLA